MREYFIRNYNNTFYLIQFKRKLWLMLIWSVIVGVASALSRYYGASATKASIAGFIAVAGGVIFGITLTIRNVIDKTQVVSPDLQLKQTVVTKV